MKRRAPVLQSLVALALLALPPAFPAMAASATIPGAAASQDQLKPIFEALAERDRRALQEALLWTGDYAGVVNGVFGSRTRDALLVFARKAGVSGDLALDPQPRAALLAAAAAARAAVGFVSLKDKQAGVALALPLKLLPRRVSTDGGTHYASLDGAIVVDTLSRPVGPGGLPEMFDRMSATSGTRKVTYKLLKPDFFVVSGEIAERKFYSRFVLGPIEGQSLVRGLTLAYPKVDAARLDPVALASAASFEAFPADNGAVAGGPPAGSPVPATPTAVLPAKPPLASFALTAIRIDASTGLTHLPGPACQNPTVAGIPLVVTKVDEGTGLVLFSLQPVAVPGPPATIATVSSATSLVALFSRDPEGLDLAPAELRPTTDFPPGTLVISSSFQGRAEGSPIVDRQGRLVGIATGPRRLPPTVAGTRLQGDYPVIAATRVQAFLGDPGLATAADDLPPQSLGAIVAQWRPRLVRIVCQTAMR